MAKLEGEGQLTPYESPVQPLTFFQQRLPTDDGQLHFLVPAGVGDNLWVVSKLWKVAQERNCTFWMPNAEQKRSSDLYQMLGLQHGYMPDLTTNWIWSRPGSPAIPDSGAVLSIQPNRHLEHGHRIEKWYPEMEWRNPCDFMQNHARIHREEVGARKHVVGFMSSINYMEYGGNLKPMQWARIWQMVEDTVGPVVIIAAGDDVGLLGEVLKFFHPSLEPIVNASLSLVARAVAGSELVIGAHAGPLILSAYMGIPTVQFYPRWLAPMAGSWEPLDKPWDWDFLDNAENAVRGGIHTRLLQGEPSRTRDLPIDGPTLAISPATNPLWKKPRAILQEDDAGGEYGQHPAPKFGERHSFTVEDHMEGASSG